MKSAIIALGVVLAIAIFSLININYDLTRTEYALDNANAQNSALKEDINSLPEVENTPESVAACNALIKSLKNKAQ